jgi:hypothetical protein
MVSRLRTHTVPGAAQRGSSGIGLILTLVVIGYGVFVAIQYVPQHLEWITVSNVLDSVAERHRQEPMGGAEAVWGVIDRQLYINERGDLKEVFSVAPAPRGGYLVTARYQRPLNLIYTQKQVTHDKSIELH